MLISILLYLLLLCFIHKTVTATNIYEVTVEHGTLAGQLVDLVTGEGQYYSFKGIPYAQPPIGALRFKAPLPANAWTGVRNALAHGSVCPQVTILDTYIPGNEDCLFLNVYTPDLKPNTSFPVLFFIHGGGLQRGSGNVDDNGPDFFMRKDMDLVLVTINYRLDALGFLNLDTEDVPGNAGMKDQVMALKWVQKNIEKFGGDPAKVTIMGQSAGSASVGLHLVSPMSAGLFHRAIGLSGSPFCEWAVGHRPVTRAFKLGKQLGYKTRDPDALLKFLQNVTPEQLINNVQLNVIAAEKEIAAALKFKRFGVTVEKFKGENNFLSENLFKNFSHINEAEILFGHTNLEGINKIAYQSINILLKQFDAFVENFAPTYLLENFAPDVGIDVGTKVRDYYMGNKSVNAAAMKEFVTYITDAFFKYDILRYFSKIPTSKPKYMYQFSAISRRNVYGQSGALYNVIGAAHIDDLNHLFDPKSLSLFLDLNSTEFDIIVRYTTVIRNFVHSGKPTSSLQPEGTWPEFDDKTMKYVDIGTTESTVLSLNDEDYPKFWSELLKSVANYY